ncbi:MAG TPA: type 1 glutamine amidotransferase domain-containing protein [Patescibacteria group bacterium]|jgi:protease I|nr:type 1 glutamine amidotransferase domain-containing protein [Patescibacteria group bacterium]
MDLADKSFAVLATNQFEDDELTKPLEALKQTGATVHVVSEEAGEITGKNGATVAVDIVVDEADASSYDGLVIPGGVGNPDKLRMNDSAVTFVKHFFEQHKPVASICHGPWMLIEADVVNGRTVTSWPSLKTDLTNAGASWVDEEVVVDEGLVTSRNPDDIPAFIDKMLEEFSEGTHNEQTA